MLTSPPPHRATPITLSTLAQATTMPTRASFDQMPHLLRLRASPVMAAPITGILTARRITKPRMDSPGTLIRRVTLPTINLIRRASVRALKRRNRRRLVNIKMFRTRTGVRAILVRGHLFWVWVVRRLWRMCESGGSAGEATGPNLRSDLCVNCKLIPVSLQSNLIVHRDII